MSRETRVGMLVGLVFIFAFGLVLSELTGGSQSPTPASISDPATTSFRHRPALEHSVPQRPLTGTHQRFRRRMARREAQPDTRSERQRPRRPAAARPGGVVHTIEAGDTLIALARRYYGEGRDRLYTKILAANRDVLDDPAALPVGRQIVIPDVEPSAAPAPEPGSYVIRDNDTLTSIARRTLGDDSPEAVRRLYEANRDRLQNPNRLIVGTELVIPR